MEFKVTDIHDDVQKGWRIASTSDVEAHRELVQTELCGMTFNTCCLEDGTIGGPGLGYQIGDSPDESLDHKLLITDPTALGTEAVLPDMKPDLIPDVIHGDSVLTNGHSLNGQSELDEVLNGDISTELNGLATKTDNILIDQTSDFLATSISTPDENLNVSLSEEKVQCDIDISMDDSTENIEIASADISTDSIPRIDELKVEVALDSSQSAQNSEGELTDASTKPSASDLESTKSSESSPSVRKKKARPMSESMLRLTASKKESPDKRTTDLISAAERKARADDLRKKKIQEQRTKDEERRAAVLERRKLLEAKEREKKEALFKRLTNKEQENKAGGGGSRPAPLKGRYSLSTSNLSQLKKNKPVDLNATTVPKTSEMRSSRPNLSERPKSAMQRASGNPPQKTKSFSSEDRKSIDVKRPMTAFGSRAPSGSRPASRPSPRQSLGTTTQPARPSTALGISNVDKKKTLTSKQRMASTERLASAGTTRKPLPKAKSTSSVDTKPKDDKMSGRPPSRPPSSRPPKASAPSKGGSDSPRKAKPEAKKEMTKEEAKKALAERRKKAKEEAEEKAREEREKDEQERLKREEDEKRLAEQLRLEEETQAALLGQLKKEEEERKLKMVEEKEQRDREEKERLEEEQKLREEEIERKAKIELDRIQKEQEKQEQLLEQERIDRKKRVEMIMARVSSKRVPGSEDPDSTTSTPTAMDTPPVTASPPTEMQNEAARAKVDDILRSRGFGRSTEDISSLLDKQDDFSIDGENKENEDLGLPSYQSEFLTDTPSLDFAADTPALDSLTDTPAVTYNPTLDFLNNDTASENILPTLEESPSKETITNALDEVTPPFSLDEAPNSDVSYTNEMNDSAVSLEEAPSVEDKSAMLNGTEDILAKLSIDASHTTNLSEPDSTSELVTTNLGEVSVNNDIESVSLNDTNNNKDFLLDNVSPPVNAWSDVSNGHVTSQDLTESPCDKVQTNHVTLEEESVCVNGNEEEAKVVNGSSDIHLTTDTQCDSTVDLESNQWNKFEDRMMEIQPIVNQAAPGEEKLWKVIEGKVELSECF